MTREPSCLEKSGTICGVQEAQRGLEGLPAMDTHIIKKILQTQGLHCAPLVITVPVTKGLNLFSQHRDLLFQFAHLSAWKYFLLFAGLLLPVERLDGGSPSEMHQAILPGGGLPKQVYSSQNQAFS